eukprot:Amastigsp_a843300_14.p4 type:complete len:200 gc:universal Amastigsp_a843300_14:1139-540(-)
MQIEPRRELRPKFLHRDPVAAHPARNDRRTELLLGERRDALCMDGHVVRAQRRKLFGEPRAKVRRGAVGRDSEVLAEGCKLLAVEVLERELVAKELRDLVHHGVVDRFAAGNARAELAHKLGGRVRCFDFVVRKKLDVHGLEELGQPDAGLELLLGRLGSAVLVLERRREHVREQIEQRRERKLHERHNNHDHQRNEPD